MSAARTLQKPTPDAPDPSTPFLDPRRSATLAQIRGRGRGKKHKILKLWGIHLLLVTIYTPIDPGFGYHKSRKPGPKGPQIWICKPKSGPICRNRSGP